MYGVQEVSFPAKNVKICFIHVLYIPLNGYVHCVLCISAV